MCGRDIFFRVFNFSSPELDDNNLDLNWNGA